MHTYRLYNQFTMETILVTAFGRVVNVQRGEGDQLTEAANIIFAGAQEGGGSTAAYMSLFMSERITWIKKFLQYPSNNVCLFSGAHDAEDCFSAYVCSIYLFCTYMPILG